MHTDRAANIQSKANQCVKCGLCLPYCPTYGLTQDENESPRGRIALMHNLAKETLTFTPKAHEHIDNCLSCKECERVCPAGVAYESLLLDYRAWEKPRIPSTFGSASLAARFFEYIVSYPIVVRKLAQVLWFAQKTGLIPLAKKSGLIRLLGLNRLHALLPKSLPYPKALASFYGAIGEKQGEVALFTGCLSTLFDFQTNQDAITVLQHLGFDVHIPTTQTCCGAIAAHAGNADQAENLSQKNRAAFSAQELTTIRYVITTASGCASTLMHPSEKTNLDLANKIIDLSDFLCQITWPDAVMAKITQNLPQYEHEKLSLHTPCTLRNSLKKPQVSQNLLDKLGIGWQKLQRFEQCCGSAGTYMLSHPSASEKLLDSALINLDQNHTTRLLTSNIGCALHFQKRFTEENQPIRVCHPVSLFAEMLAND